MVNQCTRQTRRDRSLRAYFAREFRPAIEKSERQAAHYDQAINSYIEWTGAPTTPVAAVTDKKLAAFAADAPDGSSAEWRKRLAGLVRQVALAWQEAHPAEAGRVTRPRTRIKDPGPPPAGSVRHYLETVYIVEAMVAASAVSIDSTRHSVRMLNEFAGREVRMRDLSDRLVAGWFRHLLEGGRRETSVNRYRRTLFAVWRHAFDRDVVARPPRVKRLKEIVDPPDSWGLEDLRALFTAAQKFRRFETYGPLRCHLWWQAALQVEYCTALRWRSLIGIRLRDLDLKERTLFVPGQNMKNRHGATYRLSAEALDAVEAIALPKREFLLDVGPTKWGYNKHFTLLLAAAGIQPGRRKSLQRWHKLRRSVCTLIAERAGVAAASQLLQHSSEALTARYLDPARLKNKVDAAAILPSLLAG